MCAPESRFRLCEALDENNRPFYLAPYQNIDAQRLRHRAFAALLMHGSKYVLHRNETGFGFFHHSFLPPNLVAAEAASAAFADKFGTLPAACAVCGRILPCQQTHNALVELCTVEIPRLLANNLANNLADNLENAPQEWLPLAHEELFALAGEGLYEPLLAHAVSLGMPE